MRAVVTCIVLGVGVNKFIECYENALCTVVEILWSLVCQLSNVQHNSSQWVFLSYTETDPLAQLIGITAIPSKATVISYSAVVSFAVFGLSYIVSFNSATYRSLKTKEKVFWCLAFARALFGVFCTFASCWYIFVDPTLFEDVILASTLSSHFIVDVVVGSSYSSASHFSPRILYFENLTWLWQPTTYSACLGMV